MKIKDCTKRVKALLEKDRLLADNDNKLIVEIWKEDLKELKANIYFNDISDFFILYSDGNLTSAESVRRSRQIIECSYCSLRGDTYDLRHKKAVKVKKEIQTTQMEAHMDATSVYTQITKEILDTLKVGDSVYYTHPDAVNWETSNQNSWAKEELVLGSKYVIRDIKNVPNFNSLYIITGKGTNYYMNTAQFSVLTKDLKK